MIKKYLIFICIVLICFLQKADTLSLGKINQIDFKKEINENGLELIIYYNSLISFVSPYLTDEMIRDGYYEYKIIVNSKTLYCFLFELEKLNEIKFIFNEDGKKDAVVNKRILCEFKKNDGRIILSYSIGLGKYNLLNDTPIKINKYLIVFIEKFLPCVVLEDYKKVISKIKFE